MVFCLSGSTSLRIGVQRSLSLPAMVLGLLAPAAFGATATTTSFTITANGVSLTTVDTHSTVKLTAEVNAGGSKVTTGQVAFCDASFKHSCLDFRQVGTVQLTKDGTASLRFIPGPGEHRYKAVFLGTTKADSSSSAVSTLTVNGGAAPHRTKTSLTASGSNGSYTLTANISSPSSALPLTPGGTVYFQDRSNSNVELGKATLPPGPPAINYLPISQAFVKAPSDNSGRTAGVGDFNGDGKPDMVLCKKDACPVVALGNGDGTFEDAKSEPPLATTFTSVQVGDFNQDGKLDLIVLYGTAETYDQQNFFYPGAGDGTFLTPVKIPLKSPAGELGGATSVTDFNHDGIPDLVVHYRYEIGVALGNGEGGFKVGWTTARSVQHAFYGGAVGDFDGDGFQDFAATGSNGPLSLFFGSAEGTFSQVDTRAFAYQFGAADINGDGKTELTLVSTQGSDPRNLYPAFGTLGTHADRTFFYKYAEGADGNYYDTEDVLIGDFNLDGIADAAVVGEQFFTGINDTLIWLGNADGSFTQAPRNALQASQDVQNVRTFAAADFDGDGLPDLAATGTQAGTNDRAYGVLLSRVGQTAVASIRPPVGPGAHEVVARYTGDDTFDTSVSKPVSLSAPGANTPVVTLSSTALQFGEQTVSEPSNAKTVVLTNAGRGPLTISDISLRLDGDGGPPRPHFATSNNCPASLAVNASCKIRIRFVPGSTGSKQRVLAITDNAANGPQLVTLAGFGVKP